MEDPQLRAIFEGRLILVNADAREFIQDGSRAFDSIYIDPMFPPKRKSSALAKKSIRLVRALVGDDPDAAELLNIARQTAARVAVKRPTHAPPLAFGSVATIKSKLVRYDIYIGAGER
jgi:16S rRNA (guanine1516-N2)-methyltransferase